MIMPVVVGGHSQLMLGENNCVIVGVACPWGRWLYGI